MKIILVEETEITVRLLDNIRLQLNSGNHIKNVFENAEKANEYFLANRIPSFVCIDQSHNQEIDYEYIQLLSLKCPVLIMNGNNSGNQQIPDENVIDKFKVKRNLTVLPNEPSYLVESQDGFEVIKKESFLVFKGNKYFTVKTEEIAYFYINYKTPSIVTFRGEEFTLNYSLEKVQNMLSSKSFFRLNRQYLINFNAVKEVEHYFGRKLHVKLLLATSEKLLIGKEKSSAFLKWMEER